MTDSETETSTDEHSDFATPGESTSDDNTSPVAGMDTSTVDMDDSDDAEPADTEVAFTDREEAMAEEVSDETQDALDRAVEEGVGTQYDSNAEAIEAATSPPDDGEEGESTSTSNGDDAPDLGTAELETPAGSPAAGTPSTDAGDSDGEGEFDYEDQDFEVLEGKAGVRHLRHRGIRFRLEEPDQDRIDNADEIMQNLQDTLEELAEARKKDQLDDIDDDEFYGSFKPVVQLIVTAPSITDARWENFSDRTKDALINGVVTYVRRVVGGFTFEEESDLGAALR